MAVAGLDPRSLTQNVPAELDAFLQFFGEVCAVPSVSRVGLGPQGAALDFWVRLNRDNEADEATVYDAIQRYRASVDAVFIDLHVIFADEAETAWPTSVRTIFARA